MYFISTVCQKATTRSDTKAFGNSCFYVSNWNDIRNWDIYLIVKNDYDFRNIGEK